VSSQLRNASSVTFFVRFLTDDELEFQKQADGYDRFGQHWIAQLLNHLSKNAADNHITIKSIEQSDIWDGLKKKIIVQAERDTKQGLMKNRCPYLRWASTTKSVGIT
jgi:hypothetical protein